MPIRSAQIGQVEILETIPDEEEPVVKHETYFRMRIRHFSEVLEHVVKNGPFKKGAYNFGLFFVWKTLWAFGILYLIFLVMGSLGELL
tara:strand:- start:1800 stop:2063 length:264 start_codon:yes stop_codon:yes gene_type:complete